MSAACTYEFDEKKYQSASRHQKEWGSALIKSLHLRGNERILDLGCGDGGLTEQLSLFVPKGSVLGIDASAGMIQTAKEHRRSNLEFMQMNINDMDFDASFDVIFSNAALHWVKDHQRMLEKAYRALKKGGCLAWNFAGEGNCACFFQTVREKMQEPQFEKCFIDFEWPWFMPSVNEYEYLMADKDFSQVQVAEEKRDRYFTSADEMIRWIDQPSLIPFMQCLPDAVKQDFRDAVVQDMIRKTRQPDGTCFETFRRINVVAVK